VNINKGLRMAIISDEMRPTKKLERQATQHQGEIGEFLDDSPVMDNIFLE
jgi:hypothetical protein